MICALKSGPSLCASVGVLHCMQQEEVISTVVTGLSVCVRGSACVGCIN